MIKIHTVKKWLWRGILKSQVSTDKMHIRNTSFGKEENGWQCLGSLEKVHINNLTSVHLQTHFDQKSCPVFRKEMSQKLVWKDNRRDTRR